MFGGTFVLLVLVTIDPSNQVLFYAMAAMPLLLGILFVAPIGGADMPVVITLLNSYAGLAASATGFAAGQQRPDHRRRHRRRLGLHPVRGHEQGR